ncbi:hypothetical protein N7474_002157 [Penicillium riverlandense]|uniref:uncharacterized protein n=1 Tax=Penicillium riverlandense TaxID=1903569 RepID=UPI0025487FA8|nr:uncharacterized protein N7474_002157 [Penicillium riverlandense]KAJ5833846.1 hypothetical protein N7474_002157 [Penicillium riverlandense]
MAAYASPAGDPLQLSLLNLSRLFTRLEHNLLSPATDHNTLRRSEYQRMRVSKNVDYARTLLTQLERSLPQLKPPARRHDAQLEIARDRALLKRMQSVLDEAEDRAEDEDEDEEEWGTLFSKPVAEKVVSSIPSTGHPERVRIHDQRGGEDDEDIEEEVESEGDIPVPDTTVLPTTTSTTAAPPTATPPTSTLRHRHNTYEPPSTTTAAKAKATGASISSSRPPPPDNLATAEQDLSSARLEQEDLTSSLLSLAGQLKASSKSFQTTLESEKSVLDRAVQGIDKTSTTMEAAGKRMGMLRRMTEGKGWWGRMMLYAWIFGLWLVAVLIVFVGPKLRF